MKSAGSGRRGLLTGSSMFLCAAMSATKNQEAPAEKIPRKMFGGTALIATENGRIGNEKYW